MKTLLRTFRLIVLALLLTSSARAQLASEVSLYSFSQSIGFFIPGIDYPPLIEAPGVSNGGISIYGLLPVTGEGDGGSGVFVYKNGEVSTVYSDPNSGLISLFTDAGGSTAYASSADGIVSLPGGTVVSKQGLFPVVKAADGTFYGFSGGYNFYRATAGGAVVIATLPNYDFAAQLIQGTDGNFYVVGHAGFYQIALKNSIVTKLYTFSSSSQGAAGVVEAPGSGGEVFYGYRYEDNELFTLTANAGGDSSSLTILHNFATDGSAAGSAPDSLVLGADGNLYGTTKSGGAFSGGGTFFRCTPSGKFATLYSFGNQSGGAEGSNAIFPVSLSQLGDGDFYVVCQDGGPSQGETIVELIMHDAFFAGESSLGSGVYYLKFPDGNYFGYYSFLSDPHYIYHFDLGYEYVFDANDGKSGVYLYDFKSKGFFYTSPTFPFPYLYDFTLKTVLYYYPDPKNAGHYNTNGVRYFYDFATGKIISK